MSVALSLASPHPGQGAVLSNLIVADIAPGRASLSEDFVQYIHTMLKIEEMGVKSRIEAAKVLAEYEKVFFCTLPVFAYTCPSGCKRATVPTDEPYCSTCLVAG